MTLVENLAKPSLRLGKTVTLGVMLDWVGGYYQMSVLDGISDAAANSGANVFCFAGGVIPLNTAEHGRCQVYDLLSASCIDGAIVFSNTLMNEVGIDGLSAFVKARVKERPCCTIGVELNGYPSILTDNAHGIEQVVAHLTKVHRKRRFAHVRGPRGNAEAEQRFEAFVGELAKHELPFDPQWVFEGDFRLQGGRDAVTAFVQAMNGKAEKIDAIVVANDSMAIGVLEELTKQNLCVPHQIAVTGYDDIAEARLTSIPLTTVRQPLEKVGQSAARNVIRWIITNVLPKSETVDTELVVRRSCGCGSTPTSVSIVPENSYSFSAAIILRRQYIMDKLSYAARGQLGTLGIDWQSSLLSAFIAEMQGERSGTFIDLIDAFANTVLSLGQDVDALHNVIDALRKQLTITLRNEPVRRDTAERLLYEAHLALSNAMHRNLIRERYRLGRAVRDLGMICNSLSSAFDFGRLRERIIELLPKMGFEHYYVVRYLRDLENHEAQMFVGFKHGRVLDSGGAGKFGDCRLLPQTVLEAQQPGKTFVVMPLDWQHLCGGHLVVELDLAHAFYYGPIAEAIGCGLHGASLAAGL